MIQNPGPGHRDVADTPITLFKRRKYNHVVENDVPAARTVERHRFEQPIEIEEHIDNDVIAMKMDRELNGALVITINHIQDNYPLTET